MSKSRVPSFSLLLSFSRALMRDLPGARRVAAPSANLHRSSSRPFRPCLSSRVLSRNGHNTTSSSQRAFSSSSMRFYKTVEEQKSRYRSGVSAAMTRFLLISTETNCVEALLLHSRSPIPSLWCWSGILFPI